MSVTANCIFGEAIPAGSFFLGFIAGCVVINCVSSIPFRTRLFEDKKPPIVFRSVSRASLARAVRRAECGGCDGAVGSCRPIAFEIGFSGCRRYVVGKHWGWMSV